MICAGKVWGTWLGTVSLSFATLAPVPNEIYRDSNAAMLPPLVPLAPSAAPESPLPPSASAAAPPPMATALLPPMATAQPPTVPAPVLISRTLVRAIIAVESAGKSQRVGAAGERGLMQIQQATWYEVSRGLYGQALSFDYAFDPTINCRIGIAYLQQLQHFLHQHRSQWQADERQLLLACYNAGPTRVRRSGFNLAKLPKTTQCYVQRICTLHDDYRRQAALPQSASELQHQ